MTDLISTIKLSESLIETANELSKRAINSADINLRYDLLMWAALEGNEYVVNIFIEMEVHPYAISGALWRASKNNHINIVRMLLKKGINGCDLRDPLRNAVENGHYDVVKLLLENVPHDEFKEVDLGYLHYIAERNGYSDIVKLLLKYETSNNLPIKDKRIECQNTVNSENKEDACDDRNARLIVAATQGNIYVMANLLENGANIHAENDKALWVAASKGQFTAVEFLLKNGANIHANNDKALWEAASNGQFVIVEFLLKNGADIHAENDKALWMAATKNKFAVVEFLLKNGADIHARFDGNNEYPLLCAIANCNYRIVKLLIENGALIDVDDYKPIKLATISGHQDIKQLLFDYLQK